MAEPLRPQFPGTDAPKVPLAPTQGAQENPRLEFIDTPTPGPRDNPRLEFVGEPTVAPTTPGQASARAAQGVRGGAVTSVGAMGGAIAGAKFGAAAGAAFGPIGTLTGGIIGSVAGGFVGMGAADALRDLGSEVELPDGTTLFYEDMESIPLEQRPYLIAGETLGLSAGAAAAPFALARSGVQFAPNFVGRMLNHMTQAARTMPATVATMEATTAVSASVAAGAAEAVVPGSLPARAGAEIVGSVFNPTAWVLSGASRVAGPAMRLLRGGYSETQMDNASRVIQKLVLKHGDDPDALALGIRRMRADPRFKDMPLTVGQLTGNTTLLNFEAALARQSAEYGADARRRAEEAFGIMGLALRVLPESGDPAAMKAAAEAHTQAFDLYLRTRVQFATQELNKTIAGFDPSDARGLADLGTRGRKVLDDALDDMRAVETELWSRVDGTIEMQPRALLSTLEAIDAERGLGTFGAMEPDLKSVLRDLYRRASDDALEEGTPVSEILQTIYDNPPVVMVDELVRTRSVALKRVRDLGAGATPDSVRAAQYSRLADAILEDLAGSDDVGQAYNMARAWSRQLHEVMDETFLGGAMASTRAGQDRLAPELLIAKAFGDMGGLEQSLRMQALGRAAEFGDAATYALGKSLDEAASSYAAQMLEVQRDTLNMAAGRLLRTDPVTGEVTVSPQDLIKFRRDNAVLLEQHPELREMFSSAERASSTLQRVRGETDEVRKAFEESVLQKALGDTPTPAVQRAIDGANVETDLGVLVNVARNSGSPKEALAGLEATILEELNNRARRGGTSLGSVMQDAPGGGRIPQHNYLDFGVLRSMLDAPPRQGARGTLREVLLRSGAVTRETMDLIDTYTAKAAAIQDTLRGRGGLDDFPPGADQLTMAVATLAGVHTASLMSQGTGAGALVIAGAGARISRNIFGRLPAAQISRILRDATTDPDLMTLLLERPVTAAQAARLGADLQLYLILNGYMTVARETMRQGQGVEQ